jgi:hypothetical protein
VIQRYVRWYEKDGDNVIGEEPFYLATKELQLAFNIEKDNPLFDCYKIITNNIDKFHKITFHNIQLEKFDYFVESEKMVGVVHELWAENESEQTFCLAGSDGDEARKLMDKKAKLVWSVSATSNFEAMTKYYKYMDWGEYSSEFLDDRIPYNESSEK